jgi:DNA-binding transcriptional MocR family regulator
MMRDLISLTAGPGIISFAGGLPAPELFPVDDWRRCADEVLATDGRRALQYGPPYPPLQAEIARLMRGRGADVSPDQVFLVTGAQQGLHIAARLLMDSDSTAVVDEYVFTGVRQAFGGPDRDLREVKWDPVTGMAPASFTAAVSAPPSPRAAVVIPEFHNPLGASLSEAARRTVLEAASGTGVPIIEDDPYGLLSFDRPPRPPLLADAPAGVMYLGSFSKIIAPGLRLGWIVAPETLIDRLRVLKESVDLECSALTQRTTALYLAEVGLEAHLVLLRAEYRKRRDAMLAALEVEMPLGTKFTRPEGGMFVWVELPEGFDTLALLGEAVKVGVAFVPGGAFSSGLSPRTMRLNFSNADPGAIAEGVGRLGHLLARMPLAAHAGSG